MLRSTVDFLASVIQSDQLIRFGLHNSSDHSRKHANFMHRPNQHNGISSVHSFFFFFFYSRSFVQRAIIIIKRKIHITSAYDTMTTSASWFGYERTNISKRNRTINLFLSDLILLLGDHRNWTQRMKRNLLLTTLRRMLFSDQFNA